MSSIFSRNSTLDGETSSVDVFLGKTELFKGDTSSDLDLGSNDIDTSDFFSNSVLDLDSRVDLDKVVSALLVDQEFSGTGISVFDGGSEFESIIKNGLSDRLVKVGSGCDLDDLLFSSDLVTLGLPSGVVAGRNSLARKGGHSCLLHQQEAGPRYVGGDQGILSLAIVSRLIWYDSRSIKTVPSPKADLASLTARSKFSLKLS